MMSDVVPVTVPVENVNDESVSLMKWLVRSGDRVSKDQDIAEVETSKAAFALTAPADGVLYYSLDAGVEVEVGSVVSYVSPEVLDASAQAALFSGEGQAATRDRGVPPTAVAATSSRVDGSSGPRLSRAAGELVQEKEIDVSVFEGLDLVRKRDVLAYLAGARVQTPSKGDEEKAGPAGLWRIHDQAPPSGGPGLLSRAFTRRILGGAYGGGDIPGWKALVADAVWVFHFVAFAFLWVLAKVPIVSSWLEIVARVYKRNSFGFFLRAAYYKAKLKYLGRDVLIDQGVEIWGPANVSIDTGSHLDVGSRITAGEPRQSQRGMVEIGAHVHLGSYVHLAGRGGIKIGDYTAITYGSKIFSATNMGDNPEDPTDLLPMSHAAPLHRQRIVEAPVTIGDHVFVGLNACIMPGVSIGQGAIINSGAVVTRNVAPFTIIKGGAMSVSGKRVPKTRGGPGS